MTKKRLLTFVAALSAAGLTACSGSGNEPVVENETGAAVPSPAEDPTPAPTAIETASPAPVEETPVANNSAVEVPIEESRAPDDQMMDDAAATGMTARATRDEPAMPQATPAEPVEKR